MKAIDILRDQSCWTQGAMARNRRGDPTGAEYVSAVAWCIMGALIRAYGMEKGLDKEVAVRRAIRSICKSFDATYGSVESWNDDPCRTFDEVRQVLEKANV
jgi:hypothetical protein